MRFRAVGPWLWAALVLFAVAILLPPAATVDRFLPTKYVAHRGNLLMGFWLWKGVIFIDGILLLLVPYLKPLFPGMTSTSHLRWPRRHEVAAVGSITLLAFLLRLYRIEDGFSYDEYIIHWSATKSPAFILASAPIWRILYAFLAKATYAVAGPSEVAERLPSLLTGVASIPALYWLVRRSLGECHGYSAALLLALSTFHIWYSQTGTPYAMTLFFVIISLSVFQTSISSDAIGPWLRWGIVNLFLVFSQFFSAFFVLAGQTLYALWLVWRREVTPSLLGRVLVLGVFVVAAFFSSVAPAFFLSWGIMKNQQAWAVPVTETLGMLARWLLQTYSPWPGQLLLGLSVLGGLVITGREDRRVAVYLALPALAVTAVFLAAVLVTGALGAVGVRHLIFLLVPVSALGGAALCASLKAARQGVAHWQRTVAATVFGVTVLGLGISAWVSFKTYFAKERRPFRATADFLKRRVASEEAIVYGGFGYGFGYDIFRYYSPALEYAANYDEVLARLRRPQSFWLVHYQLSYLQRMPPEIRDFLETRGTLELHYVGLQESPEDDWESFAWHIRGEPLLPAEERGPD